MKPSLFLCHGAPSLAIEENEYSRFLSKLGQEIGKPIAIVIFTAHWESELLSITATDEVYETIYDFWGFPEELYSIKYPARGSKELAKELQKMFAGAGIESRLDAERGLDHGSWVILHRMYPEADIPVIQLSVNPELPMEKQYEIGKAIAGIRDEDILIIGSGATVHNLRMLEWNAVRPNPWAVEFDDWLLEKIEKWDLESLFAYENQAPFAKRAVPREEHFVPLFIAMGSGDGRRESKLLHRSYDFGTLSYIGLQF